MIALRLGEFTFARGEVPEGIAFGAAQQLHVHTLVGGGRVIDAMGMVPLRPEWSGWLTGPIALARARFLKQLAEAGQPLALRFGEFAYTVMIAEFSAEFRAGPNLPYSITLEVINDHGAASRCASLPGFAQALLQDLASVDANAAAIGDSGLIAAIDVISTVSAIGSAEPTPATIRPMLPAIAAAQAQSAQLKIAASAQLSALSALSRPAADGNPPGPGALDQFGAGLVSAAHAASRLHLLNATTQTLGRMTANLDAAGGTASGGGTIVTTGTTDLYHLAAAAYGDARGWARIAQANRLTDPAISGITKLVIPRAQAMPATGVLNV